MGVELSPLKEVLAVASVSVLCNLVTLICFTVLRINFPHHTPDVGRLVRDSANYSREQYALLAWWSLGLFLFSILVAALISSRRVNDLFSAWRRSGWITKISPLPEIVNESGWNFLAQLYDGKYPVYVGCELSDGSWIQGQLRSHNPKPEETDDRSIILSAPIMFRYSSSSTAKELKGVQFTLVSASKIVRMDVTHYDDSSGETKQSDDSAG